MNTGAIVAGLNVSRPLCFDNIAEYAECAESFISLYVSNIKAFGMSARSAMV